MEPQFDTSRTEKLHNQKYLMCIKAIIHYFILFRVRREIVERRYSLSLFLCKSFLKHVVILLLLVGLLRVKEGEMVQMDSRGML